jgi:formate hydrogenlyase transcriptional activator
MREPERGQSGDLKSIPESSDLEATIRRLQEELRRQEAQHLAISRLHQAMSAHLDHDELFAAIAIAASAVLRFSCMAVVLPGVDDKDLLVYFVESKQGRATCHPARTFPALGTVSAWVIENRDSFLAQHVEDLRPFPYCYDDCRKVGIQSHCALPLIIRGRAVGVLIFAGKEKGMYPATLLPFLREFAGAVTIAVDNRLAHDGRDRLKGQLALASRGGVEPTTIQNAVENMVGQSRAMKEVFRKISMVAGTDSSVLISGETGTGKELAARAVHRLSKRSLAPLVTVNCAALPVGIIESELFGHEKGAFTGAVVRRPGRFELADGGTIFLDEVGDLPQEVQAKLLRVLQEGEFERVGGIRTLKVNVRVIAATNRFLPHALAHDGFRSDLFYRLNVFPVHIPPLRERPMDVLPLAMHLLTKYATRLQKPVHIIDHQTMRRLVAYSWPGNVRELENVIERGLIVSDGPVLELDDDLQPNAARTHEEFPWPGSDQAAAAGTHGEAQRLLKSLELSGGNHSQAAKALGIGRTTLWRKLKFHGLTCVLVSALGEDILLQAAVVLSSCA